MGEEPQASAEEPSLLEEDCYTPIEWKAIFKALDLPQTDEIKCRLREAAAEYKWMAMSEAIMPGRSAQRSALRELQLLAIRIVGLCKTSRSDQGSDPFPRLDGPTQEKLKPYLNLDDLEGLASTAGKLADTMPKRGPNTRFARVHFVNDLVQIYHEATGKEPTRRYSEKHKGGNYGPFLQFATACLRPLDPHACSGIAGVIQAVLALRKLA